MRAALVLALLLLAGCAGQARPLPQPDQQSDGSITIRGTLLDVSDGPISDARLRLYRSDGRFYEATTAAAGFFELIVPVLESCYLEIQKTGFRKTRFDVLCADDLNLVLRLDPAPASLGSDAPAGSSSTAGANGPFRIDGRVTDASTGDPIPGTGVHFQLRGKNASETQTNVTGEFTLELARGAYDVSIERTCFTRLAASVSIKEPLRLNLLLTRPDQGAPAAPTNVRAVAGPGYAQLTIAWATPPGDACGAVYEHQIYRGSSRENLQPLIRIGNSQAFADSGRTGQTVHYYQVSAIDRFGVEGARSDIVQGSGKLAGVAPTPVPPRAITPNQREESYAVLDAAGTEIGQRGWRVVSGTGNCCENYYTTSADGVIFDFGGTYLRFSRDRGATWSEVSTPTPFVNGEGAVVAAPNGDIVGVGWDPYSGDRLWAHKYAASEDQWYFEPIPVHGPFYDRPWIGVIKGPFEVLGQVVPYVTFARSGFGGNGYIQWMSLDGIHYQEYSAAIAQGNLATARAWPEIVAPDPERDWIQPQRETRISGVSSGLGLYYYNSGPCAPWYTLGPAMDLQCVRPTGLTALDHPIIDSQGGLHSVRGGTLYRYSPDLGRTWTELPLPRPDQWTVQEWDVKANADLGVVVVAVLLQTDRSATPDETRVYKLQLGSSPSVREVLVVGAGDKNMGGGLGSSLPRFDFMTVGILPDAKVLVSFADKAAGSPQTAIEL